MRCFNLIALVFAWVFLYFVSYFCSFAICDTFLDKDKYVKMMAKEKVEVVNYCDARMITTDDYHACVRGHFNGTWHMKQMKQRKYR